MAADLTQLDEQLTGVEEQLLAELRRVRKMELEETYLEMDPATLLNLKKLTQALKHALEHSGDINNLTLQTDEHEILGARIKVLARLLTRDIATGYVHEAHELAVAARQQLERRVSQERQKTPARTEAPAKTGLVGSLKGMLKRKQTEQEQVRNRLDVSEDEKDDLDPEAGYQDKGIFSASRELAILADLVYTNRDRPPPPPLPKDRASFSARDLSTAPTPAKLAQTPEEIRRKLAERGNAAAGPSRFEAKELSETVQNAPPVQPAAPGIAQSPEEIRRKLAERQANQAQSSGRASFAAKDIESDLPPAKAEEKKKPAEAEKPKAGKAIFEAKDLSDPKP